MQIIFTLLGLALLVGVTGQTNLIGPTLLGTIVGIVAIVGFYIAQRLGMFRFLIRMIARLAKSEQWTALVESGEALDQTVRSYYSRRRGVVACWFWTLISLVASSGEIWIALRALGADATFLNSFVLQSMAMTVRSAAFAVPGQLGVQEGGYLVIGNILGIPGDIAFAISLLGRCRDLAVGIPALVAWQIIEGRMFFRRGRLGAIR
jgi:putative membrane protein